MNSENMKKVLLYKGKIEVCEFSEYSKTGKMDPV